jgi:hypothetical protein
VRADRRGYAYRTVGTCAGRQVGKTLLVSGRIGMQLLKPRSGVVYTAQDRNTAREKWDEHVDLLRSCRAFDKRVADHIKANGREALVMRNGASYRITTPNEKAGRSKSLELVVIDEAFAQKLSLVGALQPTMATFPWAQLWLLSNAGTDLSELLLHYRDLGRRDAEDATGRLAWCEFAPSDEQRSHLDRRSWREAIPTLGVPGGVTPEAVEEAAMTTDEVTFRREWLNEWVGRVISGVDEAGWEECSQPAELEVGTRLMLGADVAPDRSKTTISASGPVQWINPKTETVETRWCVEVVESHPGVDWAVDALAELTKTWDCAVAVDKVGPGANLIARLGEHYVDVIEMNTAALTDACADFVDAIDNRSLHHRHQPELDAAVAVAQRRPVGERFAWARRGGNDITALGSATNAHWAARHHLAPDGPIDFAV